MLVNKLRGRGDFSLLEHGLRQLFPSDYTGTIDWNQAGCKPFNLESSVLYSENNNPELQQGEIRGYFVDDAVIWPAAAAARTRGGRLISSFFQKPESLEVAEHSRALGRFPMKHETGVWASLGHINRNYYHRFADSIPKIYSLYHPAVRALNTVRLCYDERFTSEELALIRFCSPANVELVPSSYLRRYSVERYLHLPFLSGRRTNSSPTWATESLGYAPREYHQWYRRVTRRFFTLDDRVVPSKKVYITRRKASVRRLLNEETLTDRRAVRGFAVVELEGKSLRDQVALFSQATTIVAQHGAGLTNLTYMRAGGKVVEIMSSNHKLRHYKYLADSLGLKHRYFCLDGIEKNGSRTLTKNDVDGIVGLLDD